MKVLPIIFAAPMVRALIEDRKTNTRRIPTPMWEKAEVGDLLYVRENWRVQRWGEDGEIDLRMDADGDIIELWPGLDSYLDTTTVDFDNWASRLADQTIEEIKQAGGKIDANGCFPFPDHFIPRGRPNIHMPRWASRLTLEVTEIRRQKLQDIAAPDAFAEGCTMPLQEPDMRAETAMPDDYFYRAQEKRYNKVIIREFQSLWDSLHGTKPNESWADNPEILALTFRVHKQNVDVLLREQKEAAA